MNSLPSSETADAGSMAFVTTRWSVVLEAQGRSAEAQAALEILCRTYWRPLYGFARRQGRGHEEAQDLTQGFFAHLLKRRDLDAVRREKGRLRSYLLVAFKHFLADEYRFVMAAKRGAGQRPLPLDDDATREAVDLELANTMSADLIYERRWALSLMERVFTRLEEKYDALGKAALFEQFKMLLASEPDQLAQLKIATALGMRENAFKQAFHRFRQQYRDFLREEIAHTVAAPGDIEDELRHLVAVLRT